jgi:glycosyltransferase involved in cell wall biosynthesis
VKISGFPLFSFCEKGFLMPIQRGADNLPFLFIGSVVPRSMVNEFPAAKSPTIEIQQNLLDGLIREGLLPEWVLSTLPVRRFPHDRRCCIRHRSIEYAAGIPLHFLGLFNIEPLKTLCMGVHGLWIAFCWARRARCRGQRPAFFLYNLGPTHHQIGFYWLAARLGGARIYSLVTDIYPPRGRWLGTNVLEHLSFFLQAFCLRRLDGFIALNANAIADFGAGHPTLHLHGLVPDDHLVLCLAELSLTERTPGDPFVLAYMGSLNSLRGIDLLIEAFRGTPANWKLRIAGKGELEEHVRTVAATDSRIEFVGFLHQPETILDFVRQAHCLVNPHRIEAPGARYVFPSKLTEYMASGRPVVSTNQGKVEDVYRDYLWIAESDTPDALRKILREVAGASPAFCAERIRAAREYVLANKLWRNNSRIVADFLRQQEA